MKQSQFHMESIGRAAMNRKPSSPLLEVFPIETMTYVDGEITDVYNEDEVSGIDAFGKKYSVKVKTSITVQATWLPFDSNRLTPPDIRRGERVFVWRFGDADQYYWTTTGLDDFLRRLETIVYAVSNTKDESVTQLSPDNSWYVRICTRTKKIQLKTNRSDGEGVSYDFLFDIEKGIISLSDDLGNSFILNSFERHFRLLNADKSVFELNKDVANLETKKSINLKTTTYTLNCTDANVTATKTNYKSPTYLMEGNITHTGNYAQTGNYTLSGGFTMGGGNAVIAGNISIDGTVLNNGVNVGSTHTHPESIGVITGPPQ